MMNKRHLVHKFVLLFIFLFLVILPFLVVGNLYYLGGDDTRLYYLFPREFIQNFAANIISDNALGGANTGYTTAGHFIPFTLVIFVLKKALPFLSTQMLLYGLNFGFGFYFFYRFLSFWIKKESNYIFVSKILTSLYYISSPFLVGTLYNHQLPSIYLVSLMPLILYFFSKAVLENNYIYSVVVVLAFSIFSTTLNTTPWWLPIVITGMPFFIYLFSKNQKSFILNILVIVLVGLGLNFYWIYHFVSANVNGSGVASSTDYYSTPEYREANLQGIRNLTRAMNPLVPILQKVDHQFKQTYSNSLFINLIFVVVMSFGGIHVFRNNKYSSVYFIGLACFLISWFLFSPNFADWGPRVFIKFVTTLPFGIMFRNMYDKFALQLAFYFAFAVGISLVILIASLKSKIIKNLLLLFLILPIVLNFISFSNWKVESSGAKGLISSQFDKDFTDLVDYLKGVDNSSRYLWLPMTAPNYVNFADYKNDGHFYSGLSPLRILADKNDYAGRYSFLLPGDVFYGDKIFNLLLKRDYKTFAEEIQKLNVRYIIVDHQNMPGAMRSYLYDEDGKYLKYQDEQYQDFILGDKIKDFGDMFSLYYINNDYLNDKFYLTNKLDAFSSQNGNISYKKLSSYQYEVDIKGLVTPTNLVFLESYDKRWKLRINTVEQHKPLILNNTLVHNWANSWFIDPESIRNNFGGKYYQTNPDGSMDLSLNIYFEPQRKNIFLYSISIITYTVSFLLILWYVFSRNKKQ